MDLRSYAERLAKAMPERFRLSDSIPSPIGWTLEDLSRLGFPFFCEKGDEFKEDAWAFFGPLLDEFKCPHYLLTEGMTSWIEAVAEAVCQAAEAKAKGVPA